jgi:hypothetical protein
MNEYMALRREALQEDESGLEDGFAFSDGSSGGGSALKRGASAKRKREGDSSPVDDGESDSEEGTAGKPGGKKAGGKTKGKPRSKAKPKTAAKGIKRAKPASKPKK